MKPLLLVLLTLACTLSFASHAVAPLSPKLLAAKSVYIDNQTGSQEAADHCYEALTKWDRFKVVQTKSQAELIFRLTSASQVSTGSRGRIRGNRIVMNQSSSSLTTLVVVDPDNDEPLWQDTASADSGSRAGTLVNKLHKRIGQEQH